MSNYNLEGKVALVTGGTAGIGRETAVAMSKAGAKVVVTGRRESEGAKTLQLIEEVGGQSLFVQTDVRNEADIAAAVEQTLSNYGKLDIAFNNAGVEKTGPILEANREDYDHIFGINVWGVIASMKHEIPAMLNNGGGSIVNVSSGVGQVGVANLSVYTASKHAVEGLTKAAALEYAKENIRVNLVAPGLIATDMADRFVGKAGTESRQQFEEMHPLGRCGQPMEVAEAVLFLASDGSSFITGHSLNVDGGYVAQ